MLAIQIAAGIVLAAVVLRFWRQTLWIAVALALIAIAIIAALLGGMDTESILIMTGVFLVVGFVGDRRRRKAPIIRDGEP